MFQAAGFTNVQKTIGKASENDLQMAAAGFPMLSHFLGLFYMDRLQKSQLNK